MTVSNDTPQTKVCKDCKQEKPIGNFYTMSGRPHIRDSYCKACKRIRSKNAVTHPKNTPYNEHEKVILAELRKRGIICSPGKMYGRDYVDITCWGGVDIEVKHSNFQVEKKQFIFKPTPQQRKRGYKAHIVLLACTWDDGSMTFHLFDKNHSVFYKNGVMKSGVSYMPDEHRVYHISDNVDTLTDDIMNGAKDRWDMIETYRVKLSNDLVESA